MMLPRLVETREKGRKYRSREIRLSEYHTQALFYLDKLDVSKTRVFEDFAIANRNRIKLLSIL